MNIVAQFLQGYGQKEPYTLSDGTSDGIVVWGNHLPITDSTGNSVIDNSVLSKIIPMFGRILDTEHATMGDCRLDSLAFDKVIFSGQARRLDLPLDTSDPNEIKPDLKALKRLNSCLRKDQSYHFYQLTINVALSVSFIFSANIVK